MMEKGLVMQKGRELDAYLVEESAETLVEKLAHQKELLELVLVVL